MEGWGERTWREEAEELGIRSLIALVLSVIGLLLIVTFIAVLPGVNRVVPGLPITYSSVVTALITLVIALLLLQIGAKTRRLIARINVDTDGIASPAASIVHWTIVFLAVLIAYEGFSAAIEPIVIEAELPWTYDVAFFTLAVIPVLLIGYNLFLILDPLAEWCASKLRGDAHSESSTIQTTLPLETHPHQDSDTRQS